MTQLEFKVLQYMSFMLSHRPSLISAAVWGFLGICSGLLFPAPWLWRSQGWHQPAALIAERIHSKGITSTFPYSLMAALSLQIKYVHHRVALITFLWQASSELSGVELLLEAEAEAEPTLEEIMRSEAGGCHGKRFRTPPALADLVDQSSRPTPSLRV